MLQTVLIVVAAVVLVTALLLRRHLATQRLSRERMFDTPESAAAAALPADADESGWLTWWLFRAGYRAPGAATAFVVTTVLFGGVGLVVVYLFYALRLLPGLLRGLEDLPSGLGDIFVPFAYAAPWIVLALFASIPTLRVRRARRQRVALVEQDLPITLELLATLGEAGMGFDAALDRILDSQDDDRPLAEELRLFQLEVLAGRPRTESLRRLSRRLDVPSFTVFVSALVQAEQVGSGVAEVLRRQVEEVRNRRRENALTLAASLPVKLLFPLILCFLPGIFIAVLGPTFYQFFQLIDSLNRGRGGGP